MTMVSLQPRPGIFTDEAAGASGQPFSYVGGSLVRFYAGRAEQIGGWIKKTSTPFAGTAHATYLLAATLRWKFCKAV